MIWAVLDLALGVASLALAAFIGGGVVWFRMAMRIDDMAADRVAMALREAQRDAE